MIEIYESVLKNRSYFEDLSNKFFNDIIKPISKENNNRKLLFSAYSSNIPSLLMEEKNSFDSTDVFALSWFIGSDLFNMTKYFSRGSIDFNKHMVSCFVSNADDLSKLLSGEYHYYLRTDTASFIDYAEHLLGKARYRTRNVEDSVNTHILDKINISSVHELLSDGFDKFVKKNTPKNNNFPSSVDNKIKFLLWKKNLHSVTLNAISFKKSFASIYGNSPNSRKFLVLGLNEYCKIDSLKNKKYFIEKIESAWFGGYDDGFGEVSGLDEFVARIKLKQLSNRINHKDVVWADKQIQKILENVSVSDPAPFLDFVVESGCLDNIKFFKNDRAFFSRDNYLNHLRNTYTKDS